jgi:transcriptional regulator with XRE-family HTH domain
MPRVSGKTDKDQLLVRLGAAVRARRAVLNLSQEALADHAGIDRSHMGKVERGERNLTLLNLAKLAQALSCRPSDLLIDADL